MATKKSKQLYRSEDDRIIAGVAGGLAEYLDADPLIVRIVTALAIMSGPGLIIYILMWIFVPTRANAKLTQEERSKVSGEEIKETVHSFSRTLRRDRSLMAIIFIAIGIYFLLQNFQLLPGYMLGQVWKLWPILLILIGLRRLSK